MTSEFELNRRNFLTGTAAVAATSLAGTRTQATMNPDNAGGPPPIDWMAAVDRANEAAKVRHNAAQNQRQMPLAKNQANGDEQLYPNRIGSFGKCLPHNDLGEVDPQAFAALVAAMRSRDPADFERIPLGGPTKLKNPQAGLAFDLQGADSHASTLRKPPTFASAETAAEMVEMYWFALTRDISYSDYGSHPLISAAAAELSAMDQFSGPKAGGQVTPATIFRSGVPGEQAGPYISQFLLLNVPFGAITVRQQIRARLAGADFLADYNSWLACQRGASLNNSAFDPQARYIRNARDLSEYVHRDFSYQPYMNAALILLGQNAAFDAGNPYNRSATQSGDGTFGTPAILDLVARVTINATKTSWYHKWSVHRRLRPEEYGGRVYNHMSNAARYPLHRQVLDSQAVNQYNLRLLPMAYPEGSPVHPSYPAAHSVLAGASVTVLKAFFDESAPILNPMIPNAEGTALQPLQLEPGVTLTVGGELDKLASNIGMGRCASGVHWRSDCVDGMKLGEALALNYLAETRSLWNERFDGFSVTKFDGTTVNV